MTEGRDQTRDDRPYLFVHMTGMMGGWSFIALRDVYSTNSVVLEEWESRYAFCRAVYTKEGADRLIQSGGTSLMGGPDIYLIFDSRDPPRSPSVISVWKPSHDETSVEISSAVGGVRRALTMKMPDLVEIRAACREILGLPIPDLNTVVMDQNLSISDYKLDVDGI